MHLYVVLGQLYMRVCPLVCLPIISQVGVYTYVCVCVRVCAGVCTYVRVCVKYVLNT
jgi:hypothetical protein